jgi:hypothetical protein
VDILVAKAVPGGLLSFSEVFLDEAEFVVPQLPNPFGEGGIKRAEGTHEVEFELVQVLAYLEHVAVAREELVFVGREAEVGHVEPSKVVEGEPCDFASCGAVREVITIARRGSNVS